MAVLAGVTPKLVDIVGTKVVVSGRHGAAGRRAAVGGVVGTGGTYGDYLPALIVMGTGIALTWAPTTESIMGSLPAEQGRDRLRRQRHRPRDRRCPRRRGAGQRCWPSEYATSHRALRQPSRARPPRRPPTRSAAHSSSPRTLEAGAAPRSLDAARDAYVHGFGVALVVAAAVAFAGAAVTAIWLPAHAVDAEAVVDPEPAEAERHLIAA